jgi:hypothetical protein
MSNITYLLQLDNGNEHRYQVDMNRPNAIEARNGEEHPDWTRLEQEQCGNCPYDPRRYRYCPAALEFAEIAAHFADAASIERVDVWVHTEERSYFKNTDMQTVLKSLYGLIMATGGCPTLARLKPLARFHLPFATLEESMHRMVGAYLIEQYVTQQDGDNEPDWELEGFGDFHRELKAVNLALMKRLRQASKKDANINAIQTFISISTLVGMGGDDVLDCILPILKKES